MTAAEAGAGKTQEEGGEERERRGDSWSKIWRGETRRRLKESSCGGLRRQRGAAGLGIAGLVYGIAGLLAFVSIAFAEGG